MHSCLYGSLLVWIPHALHAHDTPAKESAFFGLQEQGQKLNLVNSSRRAVGSLSSVSTIEAIRCRWIGEIETSGITRVAHGFAYMRTFRSLPGSRRTPSRGEEMELLAGHLVLLCACPKQLLRSRCRLVGGLESGGVEVEPSGMDVDGCSAPTSESQLR